MGFVLKLIFSPYGYTKHNAFCLFLAHTSSGILLQPMREHDKHCTICSSSGSLGLCWRNPSMLHCSLFLSSIESGQGLALSDAGARSPEYTSCTWRFPDPEFRNNDTVSLHHHIENFLLIARSYCEPLFFPFTFFFVPLDFLITIFDLQREVHLGTRYAP